MPWYEDPTMFITVIGIATAVVYFIYRLLRWFI